MRKGKIYLITFACSLALTLLVLTADHLSFFNVMNLKGRDLYFQIRHAFSAPPSEANQILLVTLDDETLKRLGNRWPYPRSVYAQAINRLKPFSPRAIGFDLIFSGKDFVPENDALLLAALANMGNVVVASHQSPAGEIGPEKSISDQVWQVAVVDKPRDGDQLIRRAFMTFSVSGMILPSWETALYEKAFGKSLLANPRVPRKFIIDYRLKPEAFAHVPFWRLLEGSVLPKELQHKIVLIGPTAEVFHDFHATPLGRMPGLAINANVLSMFLRGKFFVAAPEWFVPLISFLFIWFVLLCGLGKPFKSGILATAILIFIALAAGFVIFLTYLVLDLWSLAFFLLLIFTGTTFFRSRHIWALERKLKTESKRDPLTNFHTEQFLRLKLKLQSSRLKAGQKNQPVLLLIKINRYSGSTEPNRLIAEAAQILRLAIRRNELVCRYGKDAFIIMLLNDKVEDALRFGEKIRTVVESQPAREPFGKMSFSIAVVNSKSLTFE